MGMEINLKKTDKMTSLTVLALSGDDSVDAHNKSLDSVAWFAHQLGLMK